MEPEAESWEALALALELEDSHVVPFKRKNSISPTKINKVLKTSNPFLSPCSQTRLIPGPARAVQLAMQRRSSMGDETIPTQELIRRSVEDPDLEDEDFSRNPWLFAVDFVRSQGLVGDDGVAIGTPLSQINNGFSVDRVSQIVAIVKSTTPNGLGDMMATLKDPTGTIDASIHHRVITEGELGKEISVGAVLILHKVAVFSPSRSACYLNITVSNIVKVISKDIETPLKPNYLPLMVQHAAAEVESSQKSWMPNKATSLSQGKVEGIMNYPRQNANMKESVHNTKQMERVNLSPPSSFHGVDDNSSQNSAVEKEPLVVRRYILDGMKVAAGTGINYNDLENLLEQPNPSNQSTRTDGIMNDLRPNATMRGSVQNTEQTEKVNSEPRSSFGGGGSRIWNSDVEKEPFSVTQDVDRTNVAVGTGTSGNDTGILMGEQFKPSNQAVRGNIGCNSAEANFVQVPGKNEDAAGVENHSQLLISKSSLSQWTDEQLELLLCD